MRPFISIILYGYNERDNAVYMIGEAFDFLGARGIAGQVVFVDDGSTDGTREALARFGGDGRFVYAAHERNRGIGAAIRTGIGRAQGEWVVPIPADGQVSAHEVGKLIDASRGVTLVTSRFPGRFETADNGVRRVFSVGFHAWCQLCLGGGWGMDGVWMARLDDVKDLACVSNTFVANIEIPVRLMRAGAKWRRTDLEVRKRREGASKIFSARRITRVWGEVLKAGWKVRLGRRWESDLRVN